MDYPISVIQGEPCFDSLGVIKLRCEPSVPVNDRIFAQAQAGRTPELCFTRIWSFETAPAPGTPSSWRRAPRARLPFCLTARRGRAFSPPIKFPARICRANTGERC